MPPKRKALDPVNPNLARAKKTKGAKSSPQAEAPSDGEAQLKALLERKARRWSKVSSSKNIEAAYIKYIQKDLERARELMCICDSASRYRHPELGLEPGDDAQVCDRGKTCVCNKPAASHPAHPYIMSRDALCRHAVACDMVTLRNPARFDMYTFNDHLAHGVLEVVENMLLDFDEAYMENNWRDAWAVVESMSLFLRLGEGEIMCMTDDGDGVDEAAALIARMVLAALVMLEREGQAAEDSAVKNVGWVISKYMEVTEVLQHMGLMGLPLKPQESDFYACNFPNYMCHFALGHGITVPGVVDLAKDADIKIPAMAANDPWGWKESFKAYVDARAPHETDARAMGVSNIGGDELDITAWTVQERKSACFENWDPIPKDLRKKIKEGLPAYFSGSLKKNS